jgi:hypothetical protein
MSKLMYYASQPIAGSILRLISRPYVKSLRLTIAEGKPWQDLTFRVRRLNF